MLALTVLAIGIATFITRIAVITAAEHSRHAGIAASGLTSWFNRYVAGQAKEVGAVLGINDLEATRDDLSGWRIVIVLREAGLASPAADGTP